MRDLTETGYDAHAPIRSYYRLSERIDELNKRVREMEDLVIDAMARLNSAKR